MPSENDRVQTLPSVPPPPMTLNSLPTRIGIVAIGRNEGDRLRQCLLSVIAENQRVVYVDSGSSDGSVELAQQLGAAVVELDPNLPFTAARARNLGLEHLVQLDPEIEYVQFVDGDCQVVEGWLALAAQTLAQTPQVAVVCGRRRERFPGRSPYNQLCDLEWNTPVGEALYCGGDAMMRVSALQRAGGYNSALIAGEEPELCVRLRAQGNSILRLDAEMTLHDANMTQFSQWWKRMVRAGHAYAEGADLHGGAPFYHWQKEVNRLWIWAVVSLLAVGCVGITQGLSLTLLLLYPAMFFKAVYKLQSLFEMSGDSARLYAGSLILGKLPQIQGMLWFHYNRLRRQQAPLIEYDVP
jgi:glycosyltransferase involved in cell wall biosynthesis